SSIKTIRRSRSILRCQPFRAGNAARVMQSTKTTPNKSSAVPLQRRLNPWAASYPTKNRHPTSGVEAVEERKLPSVLLRWFVVPINADKLKVIVHFSSRYISICRLIWYRRGFPQLLSSRSLHSLSETSTGLSILTDKRACNGQIIPQRKSLAKVVVDLAGGVSFARD